MESSLDLGSALVLPLSSYVTLDNSLILSSAVTNEGNNSCLLYQKVVTRISVSYI